MTQQTWNELKAIYDQAGEMVEKMMNILADDIMLIEDSNLILASKDCAAEIQDLLSAIIENPENSITP